jgi:restriction endonuclease Mrr
MELIEYFSKNPDALQKLEDRKFEKLLDVIFRNHGYITELGPGWGDGGIDLRLIQKDSVGQILTLVQAKRYKKENPIRLDAVKALTATVDRENANRGLFVTTSRYLPGVEKWASEQPTKIILAKSEDVAEWCLKISRTKTQLK